MRLRLVLSTLAVFVTASSSAAAAPCPSKHASTVATTPAGRIVETDGPGGNDEYGLTTHLHLCRPGGREVRVENHGGGIAVGVESVTSASHYIGFREVFTDVACSKYQGDGCSSARLIAYDMATGRRRSVVGVGPAFVLTDSGWLAWLADGTVRARVAGATRTLDAGPVDAASLTATGTTVSWTRGGAPQSADLG